MHDPVQGKDLAHILNDLLTERALGLVAGEGEAAQWRWAGRPALSLEPPATEPLGPPEVSFGAFLRAKVTTRCSPLGQPCVM